MFSDLQWIDSDLQLEGGDATEPWLELDANIVTTAFERLNGPGGFSEPAVWRGSKVLWLPVVNRYPSNCASSCGHD